MTYFCILQRDVKRTDSFMSESMKQETEGFIYEIKFESYAEG